MWIDPFLPRRKSNLFYQIQYDYTKGQLPELIDVIIDEKASLFVCAVGVPPKMVVDKLHNAGIPIMNVRIPNPFPLHLYWLIILT